MSDFSIGLLTNAIDGVSKTSPSIVLRFPPDNFSTLIQPTIGSISVGNINLLNRNTIPGYLTGKRPVRGQLYPRGVYNK